MVSVCLRLACWHHSLTLIIFSCVHIAHAVRWLVFIGMHACRAWLTDSTVGPGKLVARVDPGLGWLV